MSENVKRSTRNRKPPTYYQSEIIDVANLGYGHTNIIKETVSPAVELNLNAKIFVKFINQLNKSMCFWSIGLKDYLMKEQQVEGDQMIPQPSQPNKYGNKKAPYTSITKKMPTHRKDSREDGTKKQKELYNFKDQAKHSELIGTLAKTQGNQKSKTYNKNNYPTNNLYVNSPQVLMNQFSQQKVPNNLYSLVKNTDHDRFQMISKAVSDQEKMVHGQFSQDKVRSLHSQEKQNKSRMEKQKVFGRSAYHIAIAYHIHLDKVKQTKGGQTNIYDLDPTYNSKKLKEKNKDAP